MEILSKVITVWVICFALSVPLMLYVDRRLEETKYPIGDLIFLFVFSPAILPFLIGTIISETKTWQKGLTIKNPFYKEKKD